MAIHIMLMKMTVFWHSQTTHFLGGSFTRQVTLTGTSEKVYESYDDFISAYKKVFIPQSIATFTDAESRVTTC